MWQKSVTCSRIDRDLVNSAAGSVWPFMTLTALPRRLSDHNPLLLLVNEEVDWGLRPFRSIYTWWDHLDFKQFLEQTWSSLLDSSIMGKFQTLREKLKNWNVIVFGDLGSKVASIQSLLDDLEVLSETRDLTVEEVWSLHSYKHSR